MIATWQVVVYALRHGRSTRRLLERLFVAGVAITTRVLTEALPQVDLTLPQWRARIAEPVAELDRVAGAFDAFR